MAPLVAEAMTSARESWYVVPIRTNLSREKTKPGSI
jgi:hypothetical protein